LTAVTFTALSWLVVATPLTVALLAIVNLDAVISPLKLPVAAFSSPAKVALPFSSILKVSLPA
jgi:hypothetical protein